MAGCCDCLVSCEHHFEDQISTLEGLLYAINHDENHTFFFRQNPERALPFKNPPETRRWAIFGKAKRRFGSGYISTWNLKDEHGENLGLCYTERGQLGFTLEAAKRSKDVTHDSPSSSDNLTTTVYIISTSELDETMRNATYAALRNLITITPA